jgi:hypothetical protein
MAHALYVSSKQEVRVGNPILKEHSMKLIKKMLLAVVIAASASVAQASMINVGGVTWDPDAGPGADSDFTARYSFNQFFTTAGNAVADTVNAKADYTKSIAPGTAPIGSVLQGVGEISSFNGIIGNISGTAPTGSGGFCVGCELTFTFGGFQILGVNPVTGDNIFSNGWLRIYVDTASNFSVSSPNIGDAQFAGDGNLFLELRAKQTDFQTAFKTGFLQVLFDVKSGLAAGNFDTNTQELGTDLLNSASAQFTNTGAFANIGTSTGQIFGNTVPEPSTVFLMGVALLGLALTRRKTRI